MNHKYVIPAAVALSLATAGLAQAQGSGNSAGTVGAGTPSTNTGNNAGAGNAQVGNPNINTSVGKTTAPSGDNASNNAVSTSSQTIPGAPHAGANSFTEGQARSRIQDHGFSQVTDLKLDNQGIWRGTAMRDGKRVSVAMDYQGNVTGQ